MNIYTIRDDVADFYLPPFTATNDAVATRMFIGSLGDSFPYRHGFHLYLIGSFSDETGALTANDPRLVISGKSVDESADPRPRPSNQEVPQ